MKHRALDYIWELFSLFLNFWHYRIFSAFVHKFSINSVLNSFSFKAYFPNEIFVNSSKYSKERQRGTFKGFTYLDIKGTLEFKSICPSEFCWSQKNTSNSQIYRERGCLNIDRLVSRQWKLPLIIDGFHHKKCQWYCW